MGIEIQGAVKDGTTVQGQVPLTAAAPVATRQILSEPVSTRGRLAKALAYIVIWLICFFSLFPLYWMAENSVRSTASADSGVSLWPETFAWSNYSTMWNFLAYPFHVFLINSFVMSGLVTIGTVFSSALVAYGFARFRFPGREAFFAIIIGTMMIPYAVMMIPQYAMFVNFFHWGSGGTIGSYHNVFQFLPQIVPAFFASPIFIFLLRQFIRGIPYDLDEAAKVDGASPLRIFWTIILPEVRPALAAVTVLTFIGKWNDFLGPLIYLQDPHNWTAELALNGFVGRYGSTYFNLQMAASLITIVPIAFVYFIASRQIIEGVTLSGVKG